MPPVADVAGFIEAQANLRATMGAQVIFKVPVAPIWPEAPPWVEATKYLKGEYASDGGARYKALSNNEKVKPSTDGGVHWEPVAPQTKINPDTGEPYDPTILPISAAFTDVVKTCLVIAKQGSPLRPQADTQTVAVGDMSGMDIILDLAEPDYHEVENAAEMTINTLDYHIREFKPFSIGGVLYRWLVYGQER